MAASFEIPVDGAVIRGETAGFGLPVVFLHAEIVDRRMWAGQMSLLAAEGFHVISYDRRGHGETRTRDEAFSHLVDLEKVLDGLGLHAAVLVGAGAGGALAIDFALEHPGRTVGLVLVGTGISGAEPVEPDEEIAQVEDAFDYARERGNVETAARIAAHLWLDGPTAESGRVEDEPRRLFLDMARVRLAQPALTGEDEPEPALDAVAAIPAPVLLVVGDLDLPETVERHDDLSEELDNAFAVVLEDTARLPSLERPDLFDPLLIEFLEAVTGRTDDDEDDEDN